MHIANDECAEHPEVLVHDHHRPIEGRCSYGST